MIDGMLDWLVQGLGLGARSDLLSQMLRPLGLAQPRVVVVDAPLHRPLREAGYQVYAPGQPGSEAPDALCATLHLHGRELIPALQAWASEVRDGGMVLVVTRRGHPTRAAVCAGFLHVGLAGLEQHARGVAVLTAGRVVRWT